jgi:hypothetical protein
MMMVQKTCPLEGEIVLLRYVECDREAENEACLVFKVEDGELMPLLSILDLPCEVCEWNQERNTLDVLSILAKEGKTVVYTPAFGDKFLGMTLGYFDIDPTPNKNNEIECWGEIGGISRDIRISPAFELNEQSIEIRLVNPVTLEVYDE